jgi:hypothetical protein
VPGKKKFLLVLASGLLTALLLAPAAHAYIYWADSQNHRIGRAENDGSGVNLNFIQTGELPLAVAVDAAHRSGRPTPPATKTRPRPSAASRSRPDEW